MIFTYGWMSVHRCRWSSDDCLHHHHKHACARTSGEWLYWRVARQLCQCWGSLRPKKGQVLGLSYQYATANTIRAHAPMQMYYQKYSYIPLILNYYIQTKGRHAECLINKSPHKSTGIDRDRVGGEATFARKRRKGRPLGSLVRNGP